MRRLLLLLVALSLAGCGFHLRSQAQVPTRFAPLVIEGIKPDHLFYRVAQQRLGGPGEWQAEREGAGAVVVVENEQWQTRMLSQALQGVSQQQELRLHLEYRVETADGKLLLPRDELDLTRDYTNDTTQVLAKSDELSGMRADLYQQAFDFVLTRLRTAP